MNLAGHPDLYVHVPLKLNIILDRWTCPHPCPRPPERTGGGAFFMAAAAAFLTI